MEKTKSFEGIRQLVGQLVHCSIVSPLRLINSEAEKAFCINRRAKISFVRFSTREKDRIDDYKFFFCAVFRIN